MTTRVSLIKKSAHPRATVKGAKPVGDAFVFVDNEDSTCTVFGVDAVGAQADISSVATLTVTSADPTAISVDPPVGATFKMHGLKPSSAPVVISTTATWNDGSVGPLHFDLPCTVIPGPVTGLVVVPGTPVVR